MKKNILYPSGYKQWNYFNFVKKKRKELGLTQKELANKAGVGLQFIRKLESREPTLQMDKVDQVLMLFGYEFGPVPLNRTLIAGDLVIIVFLLFRRDILKKTVKIFDFKLQM